MSRTMNRNQADASTQNLSNLTSSTIAKNWVQIKLWVP